MLAFDEEELKILKRLQKQSKTNGVKVKVDEETIRKYIKEQNDPDK